MTAETNDVTKSLQDAGHKSQQSVKHEPEQG